MTRLLPLLSVALLSCNPPPDKADLDFTRGGRLDVYFNDPGTRQDNMWEPDAVKVMIDLIDHAQVSIDFAVMGFSYTPVIDAFERAYDRGVVIRMVGDAGHWYNSGYRRFSERHIPMMTGNLGHIMHDKFMVVDGRLVFASTANWSPTDLRRNSNNFVALDSPPAAKDFTAEFTQMWNGLYGYSKVEIDNGRVYVVGDTVVEVWFSPNEDTVGRLLELVDQAQESLRFTIFAFTKDQVGSAFIRKQEEFREMDAAEGVPADADFRSRRTVAGVIDQSQLHSNGQYHEVFRMLAAGLPLHMDGNDNSRQPGDYQAGGGRLHSKTMVIDAEGEHPVVITGSFNWSASATQSNDEFLVVMRGKMPGEDFDVPDDAGRRIARLYNDYFDGLWNNGRAMGVDHIGDEAWLTPGAVVVNEIFWYGLNTADPDGFDEFIELRNTTDKDIRLDLWQLSNPDDFVVGFPPGSLLPANGLFTVLDHTLEPYLDGSPQDELTAFANGDLVLNSFNDNRQSRLYLKDGAMEYFLRDPNGVEVDRVGDGGPAFAGGPQGSVVTSMERRPVPGDGSKPSQWYSCTNTEGGANVNPAFKATTLATPGERNSTPP